MAVPFLIPTAIALATEYFPILATKLAGKTGGQVAQSVVSAASAAAGLPEDAKPADMIAAINSNKQARDKLTYEFELLNHAEHERILSDRADARQYQKDIGEKGRWRGNVMLISISGGLVLCILAVWGWGGTQGSLAENPAALALITTIAGAFLKMFSDAFAFEFGSSRGSKAKDAQIEDLQKTMMEMGRESRQAVQESAQQREQNAQEVTKSIIESAGQTVSTGARVAEEVIEAAIRPQKLVDRLKSGAV